MLRAFDTGMETGLSHKWGVFDFGAENYRARPQKSMGKQPIQIADCELPAAEAR